MSDRKPREFTIYRCPNCERLSDGRYATLCGCDDGACGISMERIDLREVLGDWEDLAAAIERVDYGRLLALVHVGSHEQGHGITANQAAAVVRALRGAGKKEAPR